MAHGSYGISAECRKMGSWERSTHRIQTPPPLPTRQTLPQKAFSLKNPIPIDQRKKDQRNRGGLVNVRSSFSGLAWSGVAWSWIPQSICPRDWYGLVLLIFVQTNN